MKKKEKLVFNTIIILIGKICTQLISFLLLPLYTNYLLTSEYGMVDIITTYVSLLVPVLSIQLDMATFRFLVDARNDKKEKQKIISTSTISLLLLSFFIILIGIIFKKYTNIQYYELIILIIIANMLSNNFLQIARGIGDNITYSIASVISGSFTIFFNIIFIVKFNMGASGMLLAMLLSNLICSIFLIFKLKLYKIIKIKKINLALLKKILIYSIPLIPNGISWWIMNASDRTIIKIALGMSENGIYAVSNKFPGLLTNLFGIYNLAWSESAAVNINSEDKDTFFSSVCNDTVKIFGSCTLLILSSMPFIFDIFINKQYKEAYLYIPILLISSFFSLMASQYGSIYIAIKETKKLAITTFFSAICNIIINIVLINKIGLYAAALSTALSYLIIMVYRHCDAKKYVNIKYEKKYIYLLMILFMISSYIYYFKNIFLNIINLFICSLFLIIINKNTIKYIISFFKNKIKQK